jgi:signal peptidase II
MSRGEAGALSARLARRRLHLLVVLCVVAVDQATKLAVVASFGLNEARSVVPGFFDLTHVLNTGGVWGLGGDLPDVARTAIFLALPAAITLFAVWYSLSLAPEDRLKQYSIALVVGGAIGNLIDRLRLGVVIDFLSFHVGDLYWPAFNVADSAICVGIGVLVVSTVLEGEEPPDEEAPPPEPAGG